LEVVFRRYQFDEPAAAFLKHKLEWLGIFESAAEVPAPHQRVTVRPDDTILAVADVTSMPASAPSTRALNPLSLLPAAENYQHDWPPPKRRRVASQESVGSAVAEPRAGCRGIKLHELRDIFDEYDRRNAGAVGKIDLIKACASNPKIAAFFDLPTRIRQEDGSRTKFEDTWREIDTSGDREISWAELLAYKVVDI
jgi:hypothetical protein